MCREILEKKNFFFGEVINFSSFCCSCYSFSCKFIPRVRNIRQCEIKNINTRVKKNKKWYYNLCKRKWNFRSETVNSLKRVTVFSYLIFKFYKIINRKWKVQKKKDWVTDYVKKITLNDKSFFFILLIYLFF